MRKIFLAALISVILSGCSHNVKDILVTPENKDTVFEKIKDSKDLSVEEVGLLQGYLLRYSLQSAFSGTNPGLPTGKTIGQMIAEQRKFNSDAKVREEAEARLAETASVEAELQRKKLVDAVAVTVYDKGTTKSEFSGGVEDMTFKVVYQNLSNKNIKGFKGGLVVSDMFGAVIQRLGIEDDDTIPSQKSQRTELSYHYNEFLNEDAKLVKSGLKDLKFVWEPSIIIFADGTKLEAKAEDKLSPQ